MRCSWLAFARRDRRGVTRSRSALAFARSLRNAARRRSRARSSLSAVTLRVVPVAICPQWDNSLTRSAVRASLVRARRELLGGAGPEHLERPRATARLAPPGAVGVVQRAQVLVAAVRAVERDGACHVVGLVITGSVPRPRVVPTSQRLRRRCGRRRSCAAPA